jgi:hypothetical protein
MPNMVSAVLARFAIDGHKVLVPGRQYAVHVPDGMDESSRVTVAKNRQYLANGEVVTRCRKERMTLFVLA